MPIDETQAFSLQLDAELAPSVPDIAPNRGFLIDANGERILSAFSTPRICISCGVSYIPRKTSSRSITETCSPNCHLQRSKATLRATGQEVKEMSQTKVPYPAPTPRPSFEGGTPRDSTGRFTSVPTPNRPPNRPTITRRIEGTTTPLCSAMTRRRMEANLSQRDLARKMNIPVSTYRSWESGKNEPPSSKLAALAKALHTSMDDLWYDRE